MVRFLILVFAIFALAAAGPLTFPPEQGDCLILPIRAVDGDTVDFYFLVKVRGRLYGVNAPERDKAATKFLADNLPTVPVQATLHGREKYGRLLIDIKDQAGVSLSETIIEAGHGKKWDGRGQRP
jgi:endonuclease YncB( thermonuclease family)